MLLIQLPSGGPGTEYVMISGLGSLLLTWETQLEFWTPAPGPTLAAAGILRNEPEDGISLFPINHLYRRENILPLKK